MQGRLFSYFSRRSPFFPLYFSFVITACDCHVWWFFDFWFLILKPWMNRDARTLVLLLLATVSFFLSLCFFLEEQSEWPGLFCHRWLRRSSFSSPFFFVWESSSVIIAIDGRLPFPLFFRLMGMIFLPPLSSRVLQSIAVCSRALQCVAACCSVVRCAVYVAAWNLHKCKHVYVYVYVYVYMYILQI